MELGKLSMIQASIVALFIACFNNLWGPIASHIGYPFNLNYRVSDLKDAAERLRRVQLEFLHLNPYPSSEICKGWLHEVHKLHVDAKAVETKLHICGRLNYFGKCKIGKEADRELKKAIQLAIDGKGLLQEAQARQHLVRTVVLQYPQYHLAGMKPYKDKVLEFLKCKEVNQVPLLGIWGMGGVGKTALLQIVRDSRAVYDQFDHVLFVKAGKDCSVEKMRNSITDILGLSSVQRSNQDTAIWNNLQYKSFLLLVDGLWDYLSLRKLGIPILGSVMVRPTEGVSRNVQRKVIFTTRNQRVCTKMKCRQNIIHMKCLSPEDSWNLFTDNVGDKITNDSPIHQLAKQMVEECAGLPKALCTIGRAMSSKRDSRDWISAVDLLMESKLSELNDMDEELFECLKLSFDALSDTLKSCFLLCSLWPQDENIPRDKLVEWWIGAGLLDVSNPIDRGHGNITSLLESSLLENGDVGLSTAETSHVKIHRMIRRMALWFLNDSGNCDKWLPYSFNRSDMPGEKWRMVQKVWVSPVDSERFSYSIQCPQLTMLVIREAFPLQSIASFQEILCLDLEGTGRDVFPMEICSLAKLQYLSISGTKIDALPMELEKLSDLKYLYMRDCAFLQTIAKGLISKLKKLLVLDLFCRSGSTKIQYFASLMEELSNNPDVVMFGINLHKRADVTELVQSSRVCTLGVCLDYFEDETNPNMIDLSLVSPLNKLRELTVVKSSLCTELVAEGNRSSVNHWMFQYLEFLELSCLPELQKVRWVNSGKNIRVVVIYNCCKLRHATWVLNLPRLTELIITYCPEMEQIIDSGEINVMANPMTAGFGSLERLYLEQLPQLSNVSKHGFAFEKLTYVCVDQCENLKAIKVEGRINRHKITIDCNTSWWDGLGHNRGMMNLHFIRRFSL